MLTVTFDCDDIEYECPWQFMAYYWSNPTSGDRDIEWGGRACSGGTCTMPKTIYPSTNMPLSIDYIRAYYSGAGVGTNVYYRFDGTVGNPNPGYSNHNLSFINYFYFKHFYRCDSLLGICCIWPKFKNFKRSF